MTVELRACPHRWTAMLAVCSDLDETPDARTYFEASRFLNTTEETSLGPGVGLEVGNTIYFEMPADQFSYRNCEDADRARVHELIASGHIDCLHSFGDLVATREVVAEAWQELREAGAIPEVWIDHARAPTNLDPTMMEGGGAVPGDPAYHADISLDAGLRYIWKGRVTSVVAKEAPLSLRGIGNPAHPFESTVTLAKEAAKIVLGAVRGGTFAPHARRELIMRQTLADGARVKEFIRSNPCWRGVSASETADGIHEVLNDRMLAQLVRLGGRTILYTHLGKSRTGAVLPESAVRAFRRLAEYRDRGEILVTTTRRLLGYCDAWHSVKWTAERDGDTLHLVLTADLPRQDFEGLTWTVDAGVRSATATLPGGATVRLEYLPADGKGPASVSVPWSTLTYPGQHAG